MNFIVIQTDFGGTSSAAMTGVCKIVDRELRIFDLTHQVPRFDVETAGENLADVIAFWPKGTVFVSVVDPGVGTSRKASVAQTGNGYYIVTPDNGTLAPVARKYGISAIREIDQKVNRYNGNEWPRASDIFHGRDVFAYCGAKLASGKIDFAGVGREYPVSEIVGL
ncbi:MAG: SAM-dependent chlorinase/fluorinase [Oscillospiraceae bacterium]|jgi:S-adenosylmethionine hydrolase